MSVADRVIAVCEQQSGREAYLDSELEADLDLDSLDRIELAMQLEEVFDISIPDEAVDNPVLGTVVGLVAYIEAVLERQS